MRTILPIAALACASMLGSCVTQHVRQLRPNEIATAPLRTGDSEIFVGSLSYEGGCLLFIADDGKRRLLPIFPTGSTFVEALITFHEPAKADQRVIIGEEIRLDGQPADWATLDPGAYAPFRVQCGAEPIFVTDVRPAN